jgi:hypothetical protein
MIALKTNLCRHFRAAPLVALCASLGVCAAHAHPAQSPIVSMHSASTEAYIATVEQRSENTHQAAILVAANQAAPASGSPPRSMHPGAAGTIDRSVPNPRSPANAGPSSPSLDANLTQFNRLPEGTSLMGSTATNGPAASLPNTDDDGPALYTIMQRPGNPAPQVRPVVNIQSPAPAGGRKRYCTVTELRSANVQNCR